MYSLLVRDCDTKDKGNIIEMTSIVDKNGKPIKSNEPTRHNIGKYIIIIAGYIIAAFIGSIVDHCFFVKSLDEKDVKIIVNESLDNKINPLETNIVETREKVIAIETILNQSGILLDPLLASSMPSVKKNDVAATGLSLSNNDNLGTDVDGNEVKAGDCVNEPILLTYTESGKDVFFLGQFNEDYHWNGYCVTNAYNTDGTLYGICESNYDDGKRIDYKSFVYDEEDGSWIYSDRKCKEGYNIGISKTFDFTDSKVKNFTEINVRYTDILSVDNYLEKHDMTLMAEYSGRTSDSKYNDTTGEAYYIQYYDDGSVKTLYQGKFVDGFMEDQTGVSWEITCNRDIGAKYMYYDGNFKDGNAADPDDETKHQMKLSKEQIDEILEDKGWTNKLKWDKSSLE